MPDLLKTLLPLAQRMRTSAFAFKNGERLGVTDRRLEVSHLERHLDGSGARIGQYLIKPGESTTKVAVLDLDSHAGEISWEEMLNVAAKINLRLLDFGLCPHQFRSSGGSGIHLWALWDSPQDAYSVRAMLQGIIAEFGYTDGSGGLAKKKIEIFPRQNSVDTGRYGNQVWLPLAGNSASVPLIDCPEWENEWIAGTREDAIGYVWKMSEPVPVRQAPPPKQKTKVATDDKDIRLLEGMLDVVVSDGYNYDLWITVGMSLHNATGGSDLGLDLWRNWSLDGPTDRELEYKWNSFKEDGKERVTGIGTLKRLAGEAGWQEPIDDYFEDLTVPEFIDTATESGERLTIRSDALPPIEPIIKDERDHLAISKFLIAHRYSWHGIPFLLRAAEGGDWFAWDGTHYVQRSNESITNETRRFLGKARKIIELPEPKPKKGEAPALVSPEVAAANKKAGPTLISVPFLPTLGQINAIYAALVTTAEAQDWSAPPFIRKDYNMNGHSKTWGEASDYLSMQDGILYMPERRLEPHDPRFFTLNVLPYKWKSGGGSMLGGEDEAGCAQWLKFLDDLWGADTESKDCLQEIFGYLLGGDTRQQKMFMIKGPPRSGKGTIGRVLRALIGKENCVDTSLKQLAGDFGLESLIGKSVAILPDARNTGSRFTNIQAAVERLLSVSGEDELSVERKGQKAWHGGLRTRFLWLTNEIPALGDSSEAFASRFVVLRTDRTWLGHEDTGLSARLLGELPGILRWALDGMDRLSARGRFLQPVSALAEIEELIDMNNPVRMFVKEECRLEPTSIEGKDTIYSHYEIWCRGSGRYTDPKNVFFRTLFNCCPGTKEIQKRTSAGSQNSRERVIQGIKLVNFNQMFSPIDGVVTPNPSDFI